MDIKQQNNNELLGLLPAYTGKKKQFLIMPTNIRLPS